jgi:hypothetical protein
MRPDPVIEFLRLGAAVADIGRDLVRLGLDLRRHRHGGRDHRAIGGGQRVIILEGGNGEMRRQVEIRLQRRMQEGPGVGIMQAIDDAVALGLLAHIQIGGVKLGRHGLGQRDGDVGGVHRQHRGHHRVIGEIARHARLGRGRRVIDDGVAHLQIGEQDHFLFLVGEEGGVAAGGALLGQDRVGRDGNFAAVRLQRVGVPDLDLLGEFAVADRGLAQPPQRQGQEKFHFGVGGGLPTAIGHHVDLAAGLGDARGQLARWYLLRQGRHGRQRQKRSAEDFHSTPIRAPRDAKA